jgi:hypothetical protein
MQEESVAKAARELWKDKGRGTVKSAEWSESDGLLMFHGKVYVPKDRELRRRIVEQHHNTRIADMQAASRPLSSYPQLLVAPDFRYIGIYVKTCDLCNQMKMQRQ